ncbi:L-lactate dehydrogenase [Clostridium butyricum]|uniref:L-lactate dehydrogenase n=1 Tax=Clostridium butyricum TaxID=1492 RepID=A0A2S7F7E2_CLOBU|nr:L-lactate dehydrogenase [Clostridium butyricum]KHD16428.1 lactate dehydrogenase [Clostridium butyricum]PPV12883.1 L-lactate dehydrogenase [Clostridium butyricum]
MKANKVAVIGAGAVGTSIAFDLIIQGICNELLMIDINKPKAESEVLDLKHCTAYSNSSIKIKAGDYSECTDMDIIVITAAAPLIKGQSRLDMFETAKKITKSIIDPIMESGFNGYFIIVTNPVDIISYYVYKLSGLPKNKVIGTGTALDSARLKVFLADLIGIEANSVQAYTIGEHGDSQFIPWSTVSVGGKNFEDILIDNKDRLKSFDKDLTLEEIKKAGWKIADVKGTTNYGIAATTVDIIKSILNNEGKIIPVSALLEGEYGIDDVYIGVPAIINKTGISEIVELRLNQEESASFNNSVSILKKFLSQL